MPPRASLRRSTRVSSRDSDAASSSPHGGMGKLQKPNLPPLQGTPSSRRQYTYGAEAEPVPTRPGRGLQRGQMIDLGSAVKDVLNRRGQDDDADELADQMSQPRQPKWPDHAEEDELAAAVPSVRRAEDKVPSRPQPPRSAFVAQGQSSESSEADDVRSFGMESDYYGDATIASTPGSLPPASMPRPPSLLNAAAARSASKNQNHQFGATHPPQPSRLQDLPEESIPETRHSSTRRQDTAQLNTPRPTRSSAKPGGSPSKPGAIQRQSTREPPEEDEDSDGSANEEVEVTSKQSGFRQGRTRPNRQNNARLFREKEQDVPPSTPKPGARPAPAGQLLPPLGSTTPKTSAENARPKQLGRGRSVGLFGNSDNPGPKESHEANGDEPHLARRRLNVNSNRTNGSNFIERARERARDLALNSSPFSFKHQHPSDRSEQDAEFQRDIRRDIQEAEAEFDREERRRVRQARLQAWRERWTWLRNAPPLSLFLADRHEQDDESDVDEDDPERADTINWWELLYPSTYVRAVLWLLGAMAEALGNLGRGILSPLLGDLLVESVRYAAYAGGAIVALVIAMSVSMAVIEGFQQSSLSLPSIPTAGSNPIAFVGDFTARVWEHAPAMSWPLRGRWDDLPELWEMDDTERGQVEDLFKKYNQELSALKKARNLHESSLKKLEAVVPKVVHMQLKNDKPVVADEFYHVLRDLAHQDGEFMMFEKKGGSYQISSEKHWQAIASRLGKDPTFTSKLDLSVGKLEDQLESKMARSWDAWVKKNNNKISELLGSELDKIQLTGSDREFDKRLGRIVKEHLDENQQSGTVVSRDEFLRHLRNEFASHRSEIRAELNELHPKLEQLIRDSVEMATKDAPRGMSRAETTTLVNGVVRKSIADMNLEALAKGKIHAHWDTELKNRVNYFNVGSGAIIDAEHSSLTYNPVPKAAIKKGVVSGGLFKHGLRDAKPLPQIAALLPWQDEGDCWCAARSYNHRGNPHGASLSVQLAHSVVPEYVVLEHALPGATTDPGARPRDVEVYAAIGDAAVRERVRDFSATHFPDDREAWDFHAAELPREFVLVGRFAYEGAELHGGVHVHQLSSELAALGAETDQVVVRAVSNYGAREHTCFYRVRLYGQRADGEE